MNYRAPLKKLETYAIWQHSQTLAKQIYALYDSLPEQEKSMFLWKLRSRASDVTSNIAESCGSFLPKDREYNLAQARRSLFGIKDSYKALGMQGTLKIDPDFMVAVDKLVAEIDVDVQDSWKTIDAMDEDDKRSAPKGKLHE